MLRSTLLMNHPARSCGVAALATMYRLRPNASASSHTLRRQGYFPYQDTLCVARRWVNMGKPSHVNRSPMMNGNYIKHNEPFETKIEIENPDEATKEAKKDAVDGEQEEVSPSGGVGSGTIVHDTNASDAAAEGTLAARQGHQSMSEKVSESHCFTCASDASKANLKRPGATSTATSTAAKTSTEVSAKEPEKVTTTGITPAAAAAAALSSTVKAAPTTGASKATAPTITITTGAAPAKAVGKTGIKPRADGVVISEKVSDIPVRRVLEKVWEHLWPKKQPVIRLLVVGSVVCVLLAKVLKVALPFWFKSVIDVLSGGATAATATATLGPVTLGAFGLVTAYGICRLSAVTVEELKTVLFAPVGGHSSTALAMQMVDKLHQLDLSFHLNRETGVLSKDLDRGSRAFWTLAYSLLFMVVPTAFEMGLVCTALNTQAGPQFIIIAVVAVVAYISWTLIITNWRAKFRSRYNALDSRVGGLIVDSLLNFETVKYFGSEKYESARIRKETTNMNHQLVILDQTVAVLNYGQQLIFVTAAVLSLYFATCGVLAGVMTVGDLVLVDALLMQLYMPLSYLGMIYREIQTSTQNMQAMIALLDQKSSVNEIADAKPYVYKDGTIELRDVTFEYRKEQDRVVLKNLSLTIPGGQTVAFVGPSGSGKSTIFRLLFRFFDPTSGEILFDGQPLSQLKLESVRDQMGVIPQDTVLFNETVMYNIRYSKLDATDEEVHEAAQKASLHDAVMQMENGYNTPVGERGLKLSGGEKQRVAIARVLLDDPPIILADEATSALDSTTELNVMDTLRSVTGREKPRTTILIAHRLTTVKQADIIFVLDGKGGLAEQGSHAELLSANGLYAQLWNQQLKDHRRATADVPKEE